ncbi:MAG: hypothetical protein U9N54_07675 [candidate division Zixibacteria bacterium]|nr:hypothetical protein [candidate division Zixibacteria bacterium]
MNQQNELKRITRQLKLKAEIENNLLPRIMNCSSSANQEQYTMGDLQDLKWMTKTYTHDSSGEVDGWERYYTGPNPILVKTIGSPELEILNPGETLY